MTDLTLYTTDAGDITPSHILSALRAAGVESGQTIFVHSDVSVFGKLALFDRSALCQAFVDALSAAVGDTGNVIVPTFTYSFCRKEPYDVRKTPSTVGVLTEYIRTQPGVVRSRHPIFSVAAWGPDAEALTRVGWDSFGSDSIFGHLEQANGHIVFLGAPFVSCTFFHYIEQRVQIPYRTDREFCGTLIDESGNASQECATYFVRPLDQNIELDADKVERSLEENGLLRRATLGAGTVLAISASDFLSYGRKELARDPYFFLVPQTS